MSSTKFHSKSTALDVIKEFNANLEGKVILITGCTSGIGTETARALATAHGHVFITARDMKKGATVLDDIKKTSGNNNVELMELDLNSLKSVRNCVEQFRSRHLPIHILICNAGIMAWPYQKTVDGFESHFGVNHLGHFLLVTSLLPELRLGQPSRVITVSSLANKRSGINWDDVNWEHNYDKWKAYGQSKTANILFAKQFDKLYGSEGIHAYSLHPGIVTTNLAQHIPYEEKVALGWFDENPTLRDLMKNSEQGASTTVYAAIAPELDQHGGEYLEDCAISKGICPEESYWEGLAPHATDMESAQRLWKLSEEMTRNK